MSAALPARNPAAGVFANRSAILMVLDARPVDRAASLSARASSTTLRHSESACANRSFHEVARTSSDSTSSISFENASSTFFHQDLLSVYPEAAHAEPRALKPPFDTIQQFPRLSSPVLRSYRRGVHSMSRSCCTPWRSVPAVAELVDGIRGALHRIQSAFHCPVFTFEFLFLRRQLPIERFNLPF